MPVDFTCPHCGNTMKVGDQYVGQTGPCVSCGTEVTIGAPVKSTSPPNAHVRAPTKSSSAPILVIVLTVVIGIMACGGLGMVALLLPAVQAAREAARRMQCQNNLKQIAIAMHNYHDVNGSFPPAYTVDADGNKLHSWRTLLLPYVEQGAVYNQLDLDKPWDAPENLQFSQLMIPVYSCPSAHHQPASTSYVVVTGPGTLFEGEKGVSYADILDGTSNTIMIVEVESPLATSWMEPTDIDISQVQAAGGMSSYHPGGGQVALADGSVRFIADSIDPQVLQAALTRNGGEVMGLD